ncbi:MAG: hypothetical protein C5B48_04765 [Candidatus Rokuibacteriota bacterium]|nr:MAG: hypothetical protein C5B48_04765 [Candidatus Rokubacteria bacterium]
MKLALFGAIVILVGIALFAYFVRLERRGDRMKSVVIILGLLVIESVIYPNPFGVPAGIFHPSLGNPDPSGVDLGPSFRLPDILIPLALGARLFAQGKPLRLRAASIFWLVFVAWLSAEMWVGMHAGHGLGLVTFEGKLIIYICFFLLVAGVPAHEFAHGRTFRRFLYASALIAAVTDLMDQSKTTISANIPGLPIQDLGQMGPDTAAIFLILGLFALGLGSVLAKHRLPLLVSAVPLLLASIESNQRAELLALGAGLVSFVLLGVLGWRRVQVTPTEVVVTAATVIALFLTPVLVSAIRGRQEPTVAFASNVQRTFQTRSKQLSAQDRTYQWSKALELIEQKPWFGWGLGTTYVHFDPGYKVFVTTDITHNIELDLLVRTGAFGLLLFVLAVALTIRDGTRAWLRHPDVLVAAFSLACTAALIGLLTRGTVESIFEKFRLATLLGFVVGAVASSILSAVEPARERVTEPVDLASVRPAWR